MMCLTSQSTAKAQYSARSPFADIGDRPQGDEFCGPRCVLHISRYYGKNDGVDLYDVIRELQWPNIANGTDLASLDKYLTRLGVHTLAVRIRAGATVSWGYPVLVHLVSDVQGDNIGHFIVWYPPTAELRKPQSGPVVGFKGPLHSKTRRKMSGVVLLTAPNAIELDEARSACTFEGPNTVLSIACALVLVAISLVAVRAFRGHALRRRTLITT